MREILVGLRNRIGVRGSLLLTSDGVVVASDLSDGLDPDSVAALASAALSETSRAAKRVAIGEPKQIVLTSALARLLLEPLDGLILVVVTEPGLELEHTLLEIAGPMRRIRELSRLDSTS
jgi:predicted regulator of Ras-like GTPase activity (Roadblock/LC7/MglB family)